jgi:alpha-N-arabinofuranosidase
MAKIIIDTQDRIGRISPDIYGQYLEHWGRCIYDGLWAEMLQSRKFAEPDWENNQNYGVVKPWFAINRNPDMHYMHDNSMFYTGRQSQKITLKKKDGKAQGIGQGGLWLVAGREYDVILNMRQTGMSGSVVVAIGSEAEVLDSHTTEAVGDGWTRFSFKLRAARTERNGMFSITFSEPGTLWIGTASLMPSDNYHGMRKDVLDVIKAIRPAHIRWPGGNFASSYHWREGIGDRDIRPPVYDTNWLTWDPNDFGTDEFLKVCDYVNTKPYICANSGDGTPEAAAAWVEYCNGSSDSEFGKLRALNGHAEPYDIKLWGIGNEMFGNWQVGHVDERTHARKYAAIAKAMRAVDPGLDFVAPGGRYWHYPEWNQALLEDAYKYLDHISIHSYAKRYRTRLKDESSYLGNSELEEEIYYYAAAANYGVELHLAKTQEEFDRYKTETKRIYVAFDEWNIQLHHDKPNAEVHDFRLRDAIYAAGVYQALQRQCDAVKIATLVQLVNTLGIIRTNQTGIWLTPTYWTSLLFTNHSGDIALNTLVESEMFPNPGYEPDDPPGRETVPFVDAQATLSEDGEKIYISVVNRHIDKDVTVQFSFENWQPAKTGRLWQIKGEDYMVLNTLEQPDMAGIKEEQLEDLGPNFEMSIPKHSVSIIECHSK